MTDLYRFLKRNSKDFFVPRFGMASHIYDYNVKFLCNRYGEVEKHYAPGTDVLIIEKDIRDLLAEAFREKKYNELIDPPDQYA